MAKFRQIPGARVGLVGCGWRWVAAMAIAVLGMATARAADAEWRTTRTEHFTVLSAAPEKRTRQLVVELEQFRASFISTFNLRPAVEPKATVVMFDSDQRFTPFKPIYRGQPKDVSGYFVGGADEIFIALNAGRDSGGGDSATETIFHEYVHLLLHTRGLKLPTWLNEGMAELFSTFAVEGKKVEYGRPKQHYVDALNFSALMPTASLIAVSEASPDYNEEERAGMFYAQSWALTHYLVCGADRTNAARLGRFLVLAESETVGPETAFRQIFGDDFKTLESNLRGYLQGGSYYKRNAPAPLTDLADTLVVQPASELEREYTLLNLRWRVLRSADTMLRALQLAERFPQEPGPQELLGHVMVADNDHTRALERWRRAAELGSATPFVLMQAVRARILELGATPDPDVRWPAAETSQLRQWVDRALRHNPRADEAIELLALVEASAAEFRVEAINALQSRVARMKDPNPTLVALAVIRYRVKDLATAQSILTAVRESMIARPDTKMIARLLQERFTAETSKPVAGPPLADEKNERPRVGALDNPPPRAEGKSPGGLRVPLPNKKTVATTKRPPVAVVPKLPVEAALVLSPEECVRADRNYVDATRGDPAARYAVAVAHALGRGAIFDPDEALTWLRQAAEAGHTGASDVRQKTGDATDAVLRVLREREGGAVQPEEFPPLSEELAAKVKAAVERGGDAPPQVVYRARARYPDAQKKAHIAGRGTVRLTIDDTGYPKELRVWGFSLPEFGKAAEASVRGWRFIPTIKGGKAVSTVIDFTLIFGDEQAENAGGEKRDGLLPPQK